MRFGFIGIILIALMVVSHTPTALATSCKCKQFPSEAEAEGTCSRTEDKQSCTMSFTSTTPEEYEKLKNLLTDLGKAKLDVAVVEPHEAIAITRDTKPEDYSDKMLLSLLPSMLAISQRTTFSDLIPAMFDLIAAARKEEKFDDIFRVFANPTGEPERISFAGATAIVSYGCIDITVETLRTDAMERGNLSMMMKTRWSPRQFFCDQ